MMRIACVATFLCHGMRLLPHHKTNIAKAHVVHGDNDDADTDGGVQTSDGYNEPKRTHVHDVVESKRGDGHKHITERFTNYLQELVGIFGKGTLNNQLDNLRGILPISPGQHGTMTDADVEAFERGFIRGFVHNHKNTMNADCVADLALLRRFLKSAVADFRGHEQEKGWQESGEALLELHRARVQCSRDGNGDDAVEQLAEQMKTTSPRKLVLDILQYVAFNGKLDDLVSDLNSNNNPDKTFVLGHGLGSILSDALGRQYALGKAHSHKRHVTVSAED